MHLNANPEQTAAPDMLRAALQLADHGMAIFPCQPRDKRPATTHGVKDATTDRNVVARWWQQGPDCNIGVATGAISGIMVLDIDDLDAEAELRKLEVQHAALPATVESITARGRHLFFRWPDREIRNSAGRLAPGIDVRGAGGYVIVPPSLHPTGRRYAWSVDSATTFAAVPQWLLDRIGKPANGTGAAPATPPAEWRDLVLAGVGEGQRNHSVTRLAGYLLRRHVDPVMALEFLTLWNATRCQPPLEAAEVARIMDSVAGRELKRRGAG
jgi:hypothetical protein